MVLLIPALLILAGPQQAGPPAPRNRPAQIETEAPKADATAPDDPVVRQSRPDFTGTWRLNAELTESFFQKMQAARMSHEGGPGEGMDRSGRRGRGGPDTPGRATGGAPPGRRGPSPADGDRGAPGEMMRDLAEPAATLTIKHADPELILGDDTARLLHLFTDGRKTRSDDEQTEIVTHWTGNVVESKRTSQGGREVRLTYLASPDGKRLFVTVHLTPRWGEPLSIRTVYDLASKQ